MIVDKQRLLTPRLERFEVEIPGLGAVVIRGISRQELHDLRRKAMVAGQLDEALFERLLLAQVLVEPQLTEQEVAAWYAAAPAGEIQPIVLAALTLSALAPEAQQQIAASFRP